MGVSLVVADYEFANSAADLEGANGLVTRALEIDPHYYAAHCAKATVLEGQHRVLDGVAEAECSAQMHACAFERWLGLDQPLDWPKGHVSLQCLESDYARLLLF